MESMQALADNWARYVTTPDGALPGARLQPVDQAPHGCRLMFDLVPGRHTIDDVRQGLGHIASALDTPLEHLWLGATRRVENGGGHATRVELSVIDGVLLQERPPFPDDLRRGDMTGLLPIGPTLDESQCVTWKLWVPGRACSGVIAGPPGSGRTSLMAVLAAAATATGQAMPVFVDGGGRGADARLWQSVGACTNGRGGLVDLLKVLVEQRRRQSYELSHGNVQMVLLDDASEFAPIGYCDKEQGSERWRARRQWAELIPALERAGIALVVCVPDLRDETFGMDDLRDLLTRDNAIVMGPASDRSIEETAPYLRRPLPDGWRIPQGVGRPVAPGALPVRVCEAVPNAHRSRSRAGDWTNGSNVTPSWWVRERPAPVSVMGSRRLVTAQRNGRNPVA